MSDKPDPLVKNFGDAAKSRIRSDGTDKVGTQGFHTSKWSEGGTNYTYRTRGGMPVVVAETPGGEEDIEDEVVIASLVSSESRWGFNADQESMVATDEEDPGSAFIFPRQTTATVRKNKAWVLPARKFKIRPTGKVEHPGNASWLDSRKGRRAVRVSWWQPKAGMYLAEQEATNPNYATPASVTTGWLGLNELVNTSTDHYTYAVAGTKISAGRIYIDGERYHDFNLIVLAAAIHVDVNGDKFLRVVGSQTAVADMVESSSPGLRDIVMLEMDMATKEVTNRGTIPNQIIGGQMREPGLNLRLPGVIPMFNASGTHFIIGERSGPRPYEGEFGITTLVSVEDSATPPAAPNDAAQIAAATAIISGYPNSGTVQQTAGVFGLDFCWYVEDKRCHVWHYVRSAYNAGVDLPDQFSDPSGAIALLTWNKYFIESEQVAEVPAFLVGSITTVKFGFGPSYGRYDAAIVKINPSVGTALQVCGHDNGCLLLSLYAEGGIDAYSIANTIDGNGYLHTTTSGEPHGFESTYTAHYLDCSPIIEDEPISLEPIFQTASPSMDLTSSFHQKYAMAVGKLRKSAVTSYACLGDAKAGTLVLATGFPINIVVQPQIALSCMKNGHWSNVSSKLSPGVFATGLVMGRTIRTQQTHGV